VGRCVDHRSIEPGLDWDNAISSELSRSLVCLPLIGRDWPLDRLREDSDWVRRELADAFRQRKYILPIVFDGGRMPLEEELPDDIRPLAKIMAYFLDTRTESIFEAALSTVISTLREYFRTQIVIDRESKKWWGKGSIDINEWVLFCDDVPLAKLSREETSAVASILPGHHHFYLKWREIAHNMGPKFPSYHSIGTSETMSVVCWPGKYKFGLARNADRVVALACQDHQSQRSRSEYQLDDHVGGKDRLWAQWRGAESLEDAPFAIDRDNRDQRKHCADGDQERHENRYTHTDEAAGGKRGWCEPAAGYSTPCEEKQNRETDCAECAKRLAQEDLDLNPDPFPESTQYHDRAYSRIE
jgi:hypothetical protein